MKLKIPILVLGAFIFFIFGTVNVKIVNRGQINISYIVDRSMSTLFIPDEKIVEWIKKDIEQKKADNFNIISFGCDINQSQIFSSKNENFHIPPINHPLCSNLQLALATNPLFNNVSIISDLKFNSPPVPDDNRNIEFIRLDDSEYDFLKILSWKIPDTVLDGTNIKIVIELYSKVDDIIEIALYYANRIKKYYKKITANHATTFSSTLRVKHPHTTIKIKATTLSGKDKYIINNTIVHKFTFTDKMRTYIKSHNASILFKSLENYLIPSSLEKSSVLIIDTPDIQNILNLTQKFHNSKHLIIFLDTFVLDNQSTYKNLEKFLPVKLVSAKHHQIFFLIDTSGSMNIIEGEEEFNIKGILILNGVLELLKQFSDINNVHIYLFNDIYRKVTFSNLEELKKKLLNITFFGNTLILPVLKEVFPQIKDGDHIYIFSDTIVKDRGTELKQMIDKIRGKNTKLFLFALGKKKGILYKVFRAVKEKIFDCSNLSKISLYKKAIKTTDKTSYIQNSAKIYAQDSSKFLFSVNNLLNTELKTLSRNILYGNNKPFVAFASNNNYITAVVLKNTDYFLQNKLDIGEILRSIVAYIVQKEHTYIHPYFFNNKIGIHIDTTSPSYKSCNFIKLSNAHQTIYLFKKSGKTFESDTIKRISFNNENLEADICGQKKLIKFENNLLRYNELYYSPFISIPLPTHYADFPQHTSLKPKINNDNKSIIWFLMSLILLLAETLRRIL